MVKIVIKLTENFISSIYNSKKSDKINMRFKIKLDI